MESLRKIDRCDKDGEAPADVVGAFLCANFERVMGGLHEDEYGWFGFDSLF